MDEVAIAGMSRNGGADMRGLAVANFLKLPYIDLRKPVFDRKYTAIMVVKHYDNCEKELRKNARVLIYDPLDVWVRFKPDHDPVQFWKEEYKALNFDIILATTPKAAQLMREALPPKVTVLHMPHNSDHRCEPSWYDPEGAITYAGGGQYLGGQEGRIEEACKKLNIPFRLATEFPDSLNAMNGSRLLLCLRLPPTDTPLNKTCKPQVKIENALECQIPFLATPHAATESYLDGVYYHQNIANPDWGDEIRLALTQPRPTTTSVSLRQHCMKLKRLFETITQGEPAIKIDLGSGTKDMFGWVTVDLYGETANLQYDVRTLEFRPESVTHLRSFHSIEHITREEGVSLLRRAYRWLSPGGTFQIESPCRARCEKLIKNGHHMDGGLGLLGGRGTKKLFWKQSVAKWAAGEMDKKDLPKLAKPGEEHLYVWSEAELTQAMKEVGFSVKSEVPLSHGKRHFRDLRLVGTK